MTTDTKEHLSLWDHELRLAQAIDELAEAEGTDKEPEGLHALVSSYVLEAAEKRDRIAWFLLECETRAEGFAREIHRMQRRQKALENAAERLRGYVVSVMETFGAKKLEGTVSTLSLAKNPDRVQVDGDVPEEYTRVIPERREPDKVAIKDAIKAGKPVPNCRLVEGGNRLVVR